MTLRLSDEEVRRARLHAQSLDDRRERRVVDVVADVVGVQAQDLTAAALAVRARSRGLVIEDVTAALATERSVVLTWSLRGTRHLHRRGDIRGLLALFGPVYGAPGRRAEQLGIGGVVGEKAVQAVRDMLAAGTPLSRREIKTGLSALRVDPIGQAAIHVIRRAALEGVLCVVPEPGGMERYVLLDDWIGSAPAGAVDPEEVAADLARRYLAAYGPASSTDFATWSGLRRPAAASAWAAVSPEMIEVESSRQRLWLLADSRDAVSAWAAEPVPLRLLGGFDTLLLGYADREAMVSPEHARAVNAGGGLIKPTVLADGRVIGTWWYRRGRERDQIEARLFRPLTSEQSASLEAEVVDVGRFLGTNPVLDVHVGS